MSINLIRSNYFRTYNPDNDSNALSQIKRMLMSRDIQTQITGTNIIIDIIMKCNQQSGDREKIIEYLLQSDICVFLCEASTHLDWKLMKQILRCVKLLSGSGRFYESDHASLVVAALVRVIVLNMKDTANQITVDCCLHFISDVFIGVREHGLPSPLSTSSVFDAGQLLNALGMLAGHVGHGGHGTHAADTSLATALLLHALLSHPAAHNLNTKLIQVVTDTVEKWFPVFTGLMKDAKAMSIAPHESDYFYAILSQLGVTVLRLCIEIKKCNSGKQFVQTLVTDEDEAILVTQNYSRLRQLVFNNLRDLVRHTKDYHEQIDKDDYSEFLRFLYVFLTEEAKPDTLCQLSNMLAGSGYLSLLPRARLMWDDPQVSRLSVNILSELVVTLSKEYLDIESLSSPNTRMIKELRMDLSELQYEVETLPGVLSARLTENKPYGLLLYLYFHCLSCENPREVTAPLLPYLVQHIVRLPTSFQPPDHVIKCLWLVYAMSSVSNAEASTLEKRLQVERTTRRIVELVGNRPQRYYTHHPCFMLWAFTSCHITPSLQYHILTEWFSRETSFPEEIMRHPQVWSILLDMLRRNNSDQVLEHVAQIFRKVSLTLDEEVLDELALAVWGSLPQDLSAMLIKYDGEREKNIACVLEVAGSRVPTHVDLTTHHKVAVLLCAVLSRRGQLAPAPTPFLYQCLRLLLHVLRHCYEQRDNNVLLIFMNREGFLGCVLAATRSPSDEVACMALQLLSYTLHYHVLSDTQCTKTLQIEIPVFLSIVEKEQSEQKCQSFLQFIFIILSRSPTVTLPISLSVTTEEQSSSALRGLYFRLQMLCCKESPESSASAYKTLDVMLQYVVLQKNLQLTIQIIVEPLTLILIGYQIYQKLTPDSLSYFRNWIGCLKLVRKHRQLEFCFGRSKFAKVLNALRSALKCQILSDEAKCAEEKNTILIDIDSLISDNETTPKIRNKVFSNLQTSQQMIQETSSIYKV